MYFVVMGELVSTRGFIDITRSRCPINSSLLKRFVESVVRVARNFSLLHRCINDCILQLKVVNYRSCSSYKIPYNSDPCGRAFQHILAVGRRLDLVCFFWAAHF